MIQICPIDASLTINELVYRKARGKPFETITAAAFSHLVYINQINDYKFPAGLM